MPAPGRSQDPPATGQEEEEQPSEAYRAEEEEEKDLEEGDELEEDAEDMGEQREDNEEAEEDFDDSSSSSSDAPENALMQTQDETTHPSLGDLTRVLMYIRETKKRLREEALSGQTQGRQFGYLVDVHEYHLLRREEGRLERLHKFVLFDMFFGVFVIANGISMGLVTQGTVDENSFSYIWSERIFLLLFSVELTVRCYRIGNWRILSRDGWIWLDAALVFATLLDQLLVLLNNPTDIGFVLIAKIGRLLRLTKMLRLMKMVPHSKQCFIIVNSLLRCIFTLAWAMIVAMCVSYVFSLILWEMNRNFGQDEESEYFNQYWSTLSKSMLSLAQIATFDGSDLIRPFMESDMKLYFLVWYIAFVTSVSLGVLNLCIGILVTAAIEVSRDNELYDDTVSRMLRHKAIVELRDALVTQCKSEDGADPDTFITRDKLHRWVDDKPRMVQRKGKDASRTSGGRFASLMEGCQSFTKLINKVRQRLSSRKKAESQEENLKTRFENAHVSGVTVNAICNEILDITGGGEEEIGLGIEDFIECVLFHNGFADPLDMLDLTSSLTKSCDHMIRAQDNISSAKYRIVELAEQVEKLMVTNDLPAEIKDGPKGGQAGSVAPPTSNDSEAKAITQLREKQVEESIKARERADAERVENRFDKFFSVVVFFNTALLGVEVQYGERNRLIRSQDFNTKDMIWFILEYTFFSIYFIELVSRTVLNYQLHVMKTHTTVLIFPRYLFNMDLPLALNILQHYPSMIRKDTFFFMDSIVVIVGTIDNLFLKIILGAEISETMSLAMRAFSLGRLLRLVRLMHLVKELHILFVACASSMRLIFWTVCMLMVMVYMGAVGIMTLLSTSTMTPALESRIEEHWGSVLHSMQSLLEVTTLSSWTPRVEELAEVSPWIACIAFVFLVLSSAGMMNLVTGVMVQAAFHIVLDESQASKNQDLATFKKVLEKAIEELFFRISEETSTKKKELGALIDTKRIRVQEEKNDARKNEEAARKEVLEILHQDHLAKCRAQELNEDDEDQPKEPLPKELTEAPHHHDEHAEDWEKEIHDGQIILNDTNNVTVQDALRIGSSAVSITFRAIEDKDLAPGRRPLEPLTSQLRWEGGFAAPAHYLTEQKQAELVLLRSKDSAGIASKKAAKRIVRMMNGTLIFENVPMRRCYNFRFRGLPGELLLRPTSVHDTADLNRSLQHIRVCDKEFLRVRDLQELLQNEELLLRIRAVGISPDQAMMVYMSLNVLNQGRVRVSEFVDGIVRLQQPAAGIDVAGAKSVMRRLMGEMGLMEKESEACNECFMNVLSALRKTTVMNDWGPESLAAQTDQSTNRISHVKRMQEKLDTENRRLTKKIQMLNEHLEGYRHQSHDVWKTSLSFRAKDFRIDSAPAPADREGPRPEEDEEDLTAELDRTRDWWRQSE